MKKVLIFIFCFFILHTNVAWAENTDIIIDGISVEFNEDSGYPFVKENRTLVPLRATMESFGAQVDWEAEVSTAVVKKDGVVVRCKIGEKSILKNQKEIPNDAAAVIVDGRTYLPIRVVLEAFGADVNWDGNVKVFSSDRDSLIEEIENSSMPDTSYLVAWEYAITYKNDGKYDEAIDKIKSIAAHVMVKNDIESTALLYKTLGECYAGLGESENAASCYKREAYYWSKAPDKEAERMEAQERYFDIKN